MTALSIAFCLFAAGVLGIIVGFGLGFVFAARLPR